MDKAAVHGEAVVEAAAEGMVVAAVLDKAAVDGAAAAAAAYEVADAVVEGCGGGYGGCGGRGSYSLSGWSRGCG